MNRTVKMWALYKPQSDYLFAIGYDKVQVDQRVLDTHNIIEIPVTVTYDDGQRKPRTRVARERMVRK
jgi:hypothetical protein